MDSPSPLPDQIWARLFAESGVAHAVTDLTGRLVDTNAAFRRRVGDLRRLPDRFPVPDPATTAAPMPITLTLTRPDTRLSAHAAVITAPTGDGWMMLALPPPDTAQLRDPLTGLPDRVLLLDRATHALTQRARAHSPLQLLVVDLDSFKQINDRHGHLTGDQVLTEVAARLRAQVRPADTVARWGGDEFIVLLDDPTSPGAERVCARIATAIGEPIPTEAGRLVHLTASCGWVQAQPGETASSLLNRADMAMYANKHRRHPTPASRRPHLPRTDHR